MGFKTREAADSEINLEPFTPDEIRKMAMMEHGRWCVERLRPGWRWGEVKDVEKKLNPCLVSWDELPDVEKKKDIDAVLNIPRLLARIGLEIYKS